MCLCLAETAQALCEPFEDVFGKNWEDIDFTFMRGTGRDGCRKGLRPALVAASFKWNGGAVAGIGNGSGPSAVIYLQSKQPVLNYTCFNDLLPVSLRNKP